MIQGNYPKSLYEAMAIHTLLERMGYSKKKEIFLSLDGNDIGIRVLAHDKEIYLRIGITELPRDEMIRKWQEFVKEWNTGGTMTKEDKDNVFRSSAVFANMDGVLGTLSNAGFDRWMERGKTFDRN